MTGMEVLVVGSGGREHALAIGLSESDSVFSVHCAPGNAGTSMVATNHNVPDSDIEGIVNLAKDLGVSLVVVGPEAPLVNGLSDRLRQESIPSFGPHSEGALLEGSKTHAKTVMQSLGIPTGRFERIDEIDSIEANLESFEPPWVIKRDVLAGGKGVTVLMEEHLSGEEASVLVIMDESGYVMLPASQDHKRVGNNDQGPNTGGMGAYAPAPVATPSVLARTREEIVEPMHHHLRNSKIPYRGCLYVGLMIDENGAPSVVEFNVRLGDPEAQVTIPLFQTDLGLVLLAASRGNLSDVEVEFKEVHAATVVLASEGYPGDVISGRVIDGWDATIEEGQVLGFVHLAGANINDSGELISTGGRVLSSTGVAPSLDEALGAAYQIIEGINLKGSHYREDIGFRAIP